MHDLEVGRFPVVIMFNDVAAAASTVNVSPAPILDKICNLPLSDLMLMKGIWFVAGTATHAGSLE